VLNVSFESLSNEKGFHFERLIHLLLFNYPTIGGSAVTTVTTTPDRDRVSPTAVARAPTAVARAVAPARTPDSGSRSRSCVQSKSMHACERLSGLKTLKDSPASSKDSSASSAVEDAESSSTSEKQKERLSLKKRKKKQERGPTSTPVAFDHLAFMEANVTARVREVDALCRLKAAETKVAEARAKREDIDVIFSLLQKRKDLENQGVDQALIDRLLPLP
jgi:hypothetical protein